MRFASNETSNAFIKVRRKHYLEFVELAKRFMATENYFNENYSVAI